ncbi:hypothetical protein C4D60_Mb11t05860 [Musa balbisiana]|uniref:Uncharacterized protein n=1 Tax=Musa balbisiana TaxID=52838 RepID=A0A4S8J4H5_MUSBA|nr:hypothetical protein C4D60_Mb11t05860 [Musa balbisiana]
MARELALPNISLSFVPLGRHASMLYKGVSNYVGFYTLASSGLDLRYQYGVGLVCALWKARIGRADPCWQLGRVGGAPMFGFGGIVDLGGASLTATTKAWQTPIDLVSTEEVRALLVEGKQPMTKDDKSTTIKEKTMVAPSLKSRLTSIKKAQTLRKRRGEDAADEDSSKPKKSKVSLDHLTAENDVLDEDEEKDADTKVNNHIRTEWSGRMESRRIMFSFDVGGPSNCKFGRYGSMVSSSQFV